MTTTVKVILAAMGFLAITTIVSVSQPHPAAESGADSAVVTELKREDHERVLERRLEAQERAEAKRKQQQDEAALKAYATTPLRFVR
jgi:hypothetical protein